MKEFDIAQCTLMVQHQSWKVHAVAHSRCVKSAAVTGGRGGRRGREQRQSGGERQQGPCCPVALACPGTLEIKL